jgi:hypothetical protein
MPKGKSDPNAIPKGLYITMPPDLYRAITADAKDVPAATFVRLMLAKKYSIALPEAQAKGRKKYATEQERKDALKAAREEKAALNKALMAAFKAAMAEAAKSGKAVDIAAVTAKAAAAVAAK